MNRFAPVLILGLVFVLQGCFPAPLKVADKLDVTVVDAESSLPIAGASVIYLVRDLHGSWRDARLVQTRASAHGVVKIDGRREWGVWFGAPGGMPAPSHFIAIWAPGHGVYVHGDYSDTIETLKLRVKDSREDVLKALESIPSDLSSSDPSLNPKEALRRGTIRLRSLTR